MPHRQPELTLTSRLLLKAAGATERWTPPTQWTVAFVSLLAVCALDMVSGARVMPLFFYLLVAGLAAWSFGERKGALFGLLVSLSGVTVRYFQMSADPHLAMVPELWNLFARVLTASLVVVLVSGMRSAIQLERWRASTDGLTGVLNKSAFQERMTGFPIRIGGFDQIVVNRTSSGTLSGVTGFTLVRPSFCAFLRTKSNARVLTSTAQTVA